jgi:hypothetical protein
LVAVSKGGRSLSFQFPSRHHASPIRFSQQQLITTEPQRSSGYFTNSPTHYLTNRLSLDRSPYKQRTPSSTRKCQVSRVASRQETYLAQKPIHKTEATGNGAHQNALATCKQIKTIHNKQNTYIQRNTKPICTYGIQLWDTAYTSNIEIFESFQSTILHMIAEA